MKTTIQPGPGRPREFDLTEATEKALQVFKAHGFAAASLSDLLDGTGLSRGSLYKAFGDKHSLFLSVLELYTENGLSRLKKDLDKASSIDALRNALLHYARVSTGAEGLAGCPITAAAMECLPADKEVTIRVEHMFTRIRMYLTDTIRRGQALGEISASQDAEELGKFLLCLIEGMRVVGKTGATELSMDRIVDIALLKLQ
ncbi:TetR/AcrR family transcriptional regulator [Rahnella sp. CG8]|nr:TetR/AcrR family transcriptional regulator [Rahnella sp. CG8]